MQTQDLNEMDSLLKHALSILTLLCGFVMHNLLTTTDPFDRHISEQRM